jgi:hypothetical protein
MELNVQDNGVVRPMTPEELAQYEADKALYESEARSRVEQIRQAEYQRTADPLFFQYQRGDKTEQEWLDAVQAVKDAHPYPEG